MLPPYSLDVAFVPVRNGASQEQLAKETSLLA